MFARTLRRAGHVRDYSIRSAGISGWEVRYEEDRALRRRNLYRDWHRVERARARFEREVEELAAQGWIATPDPANQ